MACVYVYISATLKGMHNLDLTRPGLVAITIVSTIVALSAQHCSIPFYTTSPSCLQTKRLDPVIAGSKNRQCLNWHWMILWHDHCTGREHHTRRHCTYFELYITITVALRMQHCTYYDGTV